MSSRSVVAGIALAIASIAPLSGVAHAQDLDCRNFQYQEDAQAEFDRNPSDPNRLDEDQGPDDHIACEALPSRTNVSPVLPVSPTDTGVQPVDPTADTVQPAAPTATIMPTRGTRAGIGGASGPTPLDTGIGLTLAAGAAAAGGHLTAQRLRRARRTA
ncbi:excalibur calcium-binding protein [Streptomyces sp. NPDC048338]|uniref:excalibur calcium-binding protein n=1 Tax=Streptomyces sp. NPDC048338 TaxID=3365536 RepID=UPI003716365F